MAVYAELFDGTRLEFPDGTDPSVISATAKRITQSIASGETKPPQAVPSEPERYVPPQQPQPQEESGFFRQVADVPVGVAKGAVMGVRMIADAFGANSPVSQSIKGAEEYLGGLMSAQAKNDEQEVARIMQEAEDKGMGEQVKAGIRAFMTAPVDLLTQGLGTAAPVILSVLGAKVLGAGALATKGVGLGLGAGMGSGVVKGTIYEETKQALTEAGMSEDQAEARAQLAQSYNGQNLDMILAGAALGGLASTTGIERALTGPLARNILSKAGVAETAEQAAQQGLGRRVATGAAAEAVPEFLQAGQEQLAGNIALQREGFDVPTMRGVVGSATLEGLAGAGLGAGFGAIPSGTTGVQPPTPDREEPLPLRPEVETIEEVTPPEARPVPPSEAQDTQAMIDEFRGVPPAAIAEPAVAEPVGIDTVTPAEPETNVWESIQNRDRSTPASIAQMAKIANEPDYSRVSMSRDYGTGAPIVAGQVIDPIRLGRKDTVTGSDGKKVPVQYGVIEANEVIPSHNADGTKNPSYVDPNVPAFRAITNGRVAGLQAAYNQGTAADYREALLSDDLHGIDRNVIDGMENPMLVRIMPMDQVNKNTGDISNTGAGLSFNVVEQAKNDTNRVDLSKVQFNDSGDVSPQTVRDFIKAMPDTERGNLIDKQGNPTKQAVDRLDAAIFQQAYQNDKLTELAFQAKDEEARNIVRALNMAASKAIRLDQAGDYDVRPLVNEAVEMAINARRNNMSLKDVVTQGDLTANPLTKDIVQMFADNPRSAKAIGENLSNLFDNAFAEGSKTDEDMFGAVPKRPVDQLIRESFAKKTEPDLFDESKPADKEGPATEVIANETTPELKDFDIAKSKETIHDEIKDLDAEQLSQYLVDNAPNSAARHIASKILARVKDLIKAGIPVRIEIRNGPIVRKDVSKLKGNEQAATAYGWQQPIINQQTRKLSYYKISLNGLDQNGKAHRSTGTNYQTIMHEMLHMVTSMQLSLIKKRNFKGDKQIYKDLMSVRKAIEQKYLQERAKPYRERSDIVNIIDIALDIDSVSNGKITYGKNSLDELVSHGLTTIEFQEFLSTIKMGDKTALQKLMELFRNLLGVSPEYETALDRLILGSNKLLDQKPEDINKIMKDFGYTAGKLKSEITQSTVAEEDKGKPTAEARNYLGKQIQGNWAFPEDNVKHWPGLSSQSINDFLYKIQDKQIDTKNAQQAIEKAAGEIEENINVYEKEQLYHGRTATGIRKFLLDELMPAIKELGALKLTPQDLKEYLYNRHAPERNDKMNEVNKLDPITGKERKTPWELQDRGSGISTKDAKEYLANLNPTKKAALEKVAKRIDEMVQGTQQILLTSGAEDQATIDAYNNTYKNYVPLFRIEEDFTKAGGIGTTGSSKGYGVRGAFSKRAMGSEKEVQDILGNLIAQRERALIRAEKSKVGQALYGLALTNPNPELWLPVNPDAIKSRDALVGELQSLGYKDAAQIADNLMEEPKSRYISKEKKQFIDPDTGLPMQVTEESVKLKLDNLKRFGDNVFPVRINGKDRYIFFNKNDPRALRMVHSLMNLDADSLADIEGVIAKATRWFASVNTQYNPVFGVVNLIRDIGGATLNLSTTPLAGDQAKVNRNVIPAMRGILNVLRDERKGKTDTSGKWAKAFQDFREQGGQTGYRDSLIRTDEEKQIVEREINKMKSGNTKKAFFAVVGALSDFNDMMENSIRVSAYMAALDKGLSKQKAAILAKNLTVNFDKKGQLSARINAYFAFFNASVQGTARLAKTLKGPKGKAIIGGGIAVGASQAVLLAMAGFDEDEPPEFVRERNFIVPLPDGKYLTIPYPLGFNVLPNVGRLTTEFVLSGGKDPGKKVTELLASVLDAFSPLGGSELSLQTISPTVLDPMVAIATNQDAFGRPIYKKDQATNPTPGYLRSRENASEISKNIAYFLNLASGGTKYSKGYVSPTGDEIDYLIGQVTGGVGRELIKTEQTAKAAITGEELPAYRIPLVGRFYGETQSNAAESQRFYNNIIKMADYENEVKGRIKNKEPVGPYLRDNPQARFWRTANNVENQINALNKQKKEFIEKGLPKDRIKRIENQKAAIMKRFNDQLSKLED